MNEHTISREQAAEITHFEEQIAALEEGKQAPDDFKRFRLVNGVYGIRESDSRYMVRPKIPLGILSPQQLEAIAHVAECFTPLKLAHVTTRQDFQFHNIPQPALPSALRRLAEAGLTTREACGSTVRNITCCPLAGVAPDEAFDVTPYALAVSKFFLRNPLCQNMPRKFKIAFEGCKTDHARLPIHDLGFFAMIREIDGKAVRGFRVVVGGGLGPLPQSAILLEEFLPVDLLIPSVEAALRLFDRHGNRKDRNRARLKFLLKDWGIEKFREQWLAERNAAILTRSGAVDWSIPIVEEKAPALSSTTQSDHSISSSKKFQQWRSTNCIAQKQSGWFSVFVRCPQGDISVPQMLGLASIARRHCGGRIRTTITQNFVLRWVHESLLPIVFRELDSVNLALRDAEHLADVTRCPAADTCQLGITHTRGLAQVLGELFNHDLATDAAFKDLSIKISGCPNSCGQHHIADIGLYGNAKTVEGQSVAFYRLLLGGGTTIDEAHFGTSIAAIPAKRTPEAIHAILLNYRDTRRERESFRDFVTRQGAPHFKQLVEPFVALPSFAERPELYGDLGIEGPFKVKIGKGECAA